MPDAIDILIANLQESTISQAQQPVVVVIQNFINALLEIQSGLSGSITVTDGVTSVNPTTEVDFTSGATVTNLGGGTAGVAVSGGSLTVTDGTNTVDDVTSITFDGAVVSGSTPDATVTISGGSISSASVTLTSAQILAAAVTDVEIIPAPGAGKIIHVISSFYQYYFGTVNYTGGGGDLFFGPSTNTNAVDQGDASICSESNSSVFANIALTFNGIVPLSQSENTNIVYSTSLGQPYVGGDGILTVTAVYQTLSVT